MIRKPIYYAAFACFIIATTACKKEHAEKPPPAQLPEYRLKNITWDNGVTAALSYNTDNTLHKVQYAYQSTSSEMVYTWSNNKLTEFHQEESLYKNLFEYDERGKVVKMRHLSKAVPMTNEYLFEFEYDSQGRVLTQKYYLVNVGGTHLQTETVYHYKGNSDLAQAVTRSGDDIITHRLEAYSPPVSFNACNYIQPSLGYNYVIYNYPLMMQLDKLNMLPAKISRSTKTGTGAAVVDWVVEQSFTVSNFRIESVTTLTLNPGVQGSEQTIEAYYSYF